MNTVEQRACYLNCMAACVIAEVAAMQAFNAQEPLSNPNRFMRDDFTLLIDKYGIGHNSVINWLNV